MPKFNRSAWNFLCITDDRVKLAIARLLFVGKFRSLPLEWGMVLRFTWLKRLDKNCPRGHHYLNVENVFSCALQI